MNDGNGEKRLWLSNRLPVRNAKGGYEFEGDCGRDNFIIEIDKDVTAGLDEAQAQLDLKTLRKRILEAARARHRTGDAYEEYAGTSARRYRVAITSEDLSSAEA